MAGVRERMRVVEGDITALEVDAIVNAANERLAPGGGVCGAIHRAAGPALAEACAAIGHCPTGDARLTPGFGLKARFVVHAVGPVWQGGAAGEEALLASAYRRACAVAAAAPAASPSPPSPPASTDSRRSARHPSRCARWRRHSRTIHASPTSSSVASAPPRPPCTEPRSAPSTSEPGTRPRPAEGPCSPT